MVILLGDCTRSCTDAHVGEPRNKKASDVKGSNVRDGNSTN